MPAQCVPYRLAVDFMNLPDAPCQGDILTAKRENCTVRGENMETTLTHLPYQFTYRIFFFDTE